MEGTWTPRKQFFCEQCHDVRFFIRSLDDVGCHVDLSGNDVDCENFDVSFVIADMDVALHRDIRLVFGLADVDWDIKMSCGTSCSTKTFNFGNF